MKETFSDIFEVFAKYWHEILIFELKKYGVDAWRRCMEIS